MSMQELYEQDRLARERIVADTNENFFVEASAGSGKTTMLVRRMTAMVEHGTDIREICAITFTKNAANEFYSRFRNELIKKSFDENASEEMRKRFLYALQNIDLCFMGTIDSFCQMILQEHPMEAGIPSDSRLISDEKMLALGRAELTKAAGGAYGEELQNLYMQMNGMLPNVDALIMGQLKRFMDIRDTKNIYDLPKGIDLEKDYAEEIREIRTALNVLTEHDEYCYTGKLVKKTGEFKETKSAVEAKAALPEARSAAMRNWNRSLHSIIPALAPLKNLRLQRAPEEIGLAGNGLFIPHNEKCEWYDCTIKEPGHLLATLDELRYSVFMMFMDEFSKKAAVEIRKNGYLSFYDAQLCLLEMLRRDISKGGKMIRHISERHRCFLIDEFQDTSPMQAEIFFYLTAENPTEYWQSCIPRKGSLFIVGDPKQSIYRFRNADVTSYLDVKSLFVPPTGETVSLYRNFRSRTALCHQFNMLYRGLLPEQTDVQSKYEDIPLLGEDTSSEALCGMYSYQTEKDCAVDAQHVAELIRKMVGNPSVQIEDNSKLRMIKWNDIMVITRGKKQLDTYMSVCSAQGIPVFVEGMTVFSECPALQVASKILNALCAPNDRLATYAALKSGLFCVTDRMLSECCKNGGLSLYSDGEERLGSWPKIQTALNTMNRLLISARNDSPTAVLSRILEELDILTITGTKHMEYIPFAMELLRRGENDGSISSTADAAHFIDSLITNQSDIERSLNLTGEPNCVHFANLHKVKGLEASIVILAEPKPEKKHTADSRTERNNGRMESYLFCVKDNNKHIICSTNKYDGKKAKEEDCNEAETRRLLYVAGTRAKNVLITADTPEGKHFWAPILPMCMTDIWTVLDGEGTPPPEAEIFESEEVKRIVSVEKVLQREECLKPSFFSCTPSRARVPSLIEEEENENSATVEEISEADKNEVDTRDKKEPKTSIEIINSAVAGTMVHRMMELMVSSRNRLNNEALVSTVVSSYRLGEKKKLEYCKLLMDVLEHMISGGYKQSNGIEQDILTEVFNADEYYCELPFCYQEGTTIWHGEMDLVYKKDGAWHIVDYKTNADPEDLDKRYQAQLQAYLNAFREMTGCDATIGTYHIDI